MIMHVFVCIVVRRRLISLSLNSVGGLATHKAKKCLFLPDAHVSLRGTGESLETLDVVLALGDWVRLLVVLIALFHSLEHRSALGVRHAERFAGEVSGKVVTEGWSWSHDHTGGEVLGPGSWSWWHEGSRIIEFESLKVWMLELACAHDHTAFEWVSRDHKRVSVIYQTETKMCEGCAINEIEELERAKL